jgi:eukaryotic-like serine/threonine-protein kinase
MMSGVLGTGTGGMSFDLEDLRRKNPASNEDTLQPGQVFAGFTVLAILGRGGMGEVYLAREDFTDRMVALKVLPIRREASHDAQERMRREAAAGVRLDHPNVVRVYGGGLVDGKVYISMEWLQNGKTLREILTSGSVAVESAVAWAVQIADALDAMHRGNVWHRDLKPENVIVVPGGAVKLIDFGLARVRTENLKTTKPPNMGTPHYMAPEQMDDSLGANDGRVDVYALGLILAEMLVGHHLFEDPTRRLNKQEVTIRHLVAEPPKLSSLKPSLPASLSLVVDRMLTKRPGDRPDAREIARTLAQIAQEIRQPKSDSLANARTELAMQSPAAQFPVGPATPPRHPTPPGPRGTVPLLLPTQQPAPAAAMPPRTIRMESLHDAQPAAVPSSERTFSTDERFSATSTASPHRARTVRDAAFSGVTYGVVIVAALLAAFVFYVRVVAPKPAETSPTAQPAAPTAPQPSAPEPAPPAATVEVAATTEPAPSVAASAAPTPAVAAGSARPTIASSPTAPRAQPGKLPTAGPTTAAPPATATPAPAKSYDPDKPYF